MVDDVVAGGFDRHRSPGSSWKRRAPIKVPARKMLEIESDRHLEIDFLPADYRRITATELRPTPIDSGVALKSPGPRFASGVFLCCWCFFLLGLQSGVTEFSAAVIGFSPVWLGSIGFLLSLTGFHLGLMSFTQFYSNSLGFYLVWVGFTWFYWVLPSITGLNWVLPRFTGFHMVLPSSTVFFGCCYLVFPSVT